jgi:RNA polymerase sigma-70 factor (ECF subfamily)
MTDATDRELLSGFKAGDVGALDALFERYEAPVFQFVVGLLRNHHQAEDVLQETFVRALERLEGVDPDHLRGWLFTVAYHQAMLARRRARARREPAHARLGEFGDDTLADQAIGPEHEAVRREEGRKLRALLDQLPPPQREVIRQRVYEGKRFREIAADLECPLNTALARMHEGLKRLRVLWEQNHV